MTSLRPTMLLASRTAVRLVRSGGVRRGLHTTTQQTSRPTALWRIFGAGAVTSIAAAAALACATSSTSAVCEPSSSSSAAHTPAPLATEQGEEVHFYSATSSRRASLPACEADIRSHTLAQLGAIYDPPAHTLAFEVVAGAPPPPRGLAPLELLFTADDQDAQHRHMELLVRTVQDRICNDVLDIERMGGSTLESVGGVELTSQLRSILLSQSTEPGQFRQDIIIRPNGTGGGVTRVLQGGRVFAKAGVSVSVAHVAPPAAAFKHMEPDHPRLAQLDPTKPCKQFTAAVSLVLHPVSPHVPTVHANWRFFDIVQEDGKHIWWFGGGSDLTPTYIVDQDAQHFHRTLKAGLDPLDTQSYPAWKKWADDYFRISHRGETRGVGGVFFDDQHQKPFAEYEKLVKRMGETFSAQYFPIVLKNKDLPFDESELSFQQLRRGRYAEFNLVYDKGTTYGLKMVNSRPDAVLMSLPPITRFTYKQPFETERERYTKEVLTKPKDWCQ